MKEFLKNKLRLFFCGLAISVLIYFCLAFTGQGLIGTALFIGWWLLTAALAKDSLKAILNISGGLAYLIGLALVFFVWGLTMNFFASWLLFNKLTIALSFVIASLLAYLFSAYFSGQPEIIKAQAPAVESEKNKIKPRFPLWLVAAFLLLLLAGWQLISISITGNYLSSPWQALNHWYILVILILAVLAFAAAFSDRKKQLILLLIILFSLIIHSYLLVYSQGFGGDRWRHLGDEYRLIAGKQLTLEQKWQTPWPVLGVSLPRAMAESTQLSYGFAWNVSASFSLLTGLDAFYLDKYLMIFLWSVFLTLIFYAGARQISTADTFAYLAALLPNLLYVLQYYGSFTSPQGYGAIYFGLLVLFWLAYIKRPDKRLLVFILILSGLAYFGYSLVFLLAILMALLMPLLRWPAKWKYPGLAVLCLSIFILEAASQYSRWQFQLFNIDFWRRLVFNNLLYFGSGKPLVFSFPGSQIVFLLLSLSLLALFVFSVVRGFKQKNRGIIFIFYLVLIMSAGYVLCWGLLGGLHVISRRLDVFLAVGIVWIIAYGLSYNISRISNKGRLLAAAVLLGLITTAIYLCGPVLNAAVTADEVSAIRQIRSEMGDAYMDYCVLANTWPLLALETYTDREVAAGNFFMDYDHQQPDRVRLYDLVRNNPSAEVLADAKRISGKAKCFIMINSKAVKPEAASWLNKNLGPAEDFGGNLVWKF